MKSKNRHAIALALLLGASAFLPANSVGAQDPSAPAPKPAGGQPDGSSEHRTFRSSVLAQPIGVQDYLDGDGVTDLYVANYFELADQADATRADATLPAQYADLANYYTWLSAAGAAPSADRLLLAHAGINACTSCHAATGSDTEPKSPAPQGNAFTTANTLATFFSVQNPADAILGATLQPIEDSVRTQLGLQEKTGLLVAALADEGAAAKAGLQRNDILLTLDDAALVKASDLPKTLKTVGEKDVPLKLVRAGKTLTIQIRPVTRWTIAAVEPQKVDYFIGVSATPPDDILRAHVQLPDGQGLLVTEVVPESPAEKVGVKKFDILLKLNDTPLDRTETLSAQVQAVGGKSAKLAVLRSSKTITITVTPEPRKVAAVTSDDVRSVRLWTTLANPHGNKIFKTVPSYDVRGTTRYFGQVPLQHTINSIQPPQAPSDPAALAKRLDDLDKEMKALRKAIEDAHESLKKEK
jgi:membrane-associated protease RseP (regulator of RpoE activity)